MTKQDFLKTKHFVSFGFVPLLDISKGGRYTGITQATAHDGNLYDIFCDDNMNFYCYPVKTYKKGVEIL